MRMDGMVSAARPAWGRRRTDVREGETMMARRAAVLGVALSVILASAPAIARGNPACDRSASPSAREHNPNCTIGGSASRILDGRVDDWVGESTRIGGTWQVSRAVVVVDVILVDELCLLYTSPSPRDRTRSRMPSSA